MRVFAISDIHVDYDLNRRWLHQLPGSEYRDDILILAGDVSDRFDLLIQTFQTLNAIFQKVLYVPGNHELWGVRDDAADAFAKFEKVLKIAVDCGLQTTPLHRGSLSIVPLFGWYDGSFGAISEDLKKSWADFKTCKWPTGYDLDRITQYFTAMNENALSIRNRTVISFSHFLPRIDVMPSYIPSSRRWIYPVLGCRTLGHQIRRLGSDIHVYGHSHVNRRCRLDGTIYINNALGYPTETLICARRLVRIFETASTS